jgi:predicted PurR-regulated permease PerM
MKEARIKMILMLLLLVTVLAIPSTAAPTQAPPPISSNVETTQEDHDNQVQIIPQRTQQNSQQNQEIITADQINDDKYNEKYMETLIVISTINSILLFILIFSAAIHILKDKHPYLAFKFKKGPTEYKNELDAKQYTEVYRKVSNYIRTNLKYYPYDVIKESLRKQGFTSEEIDAVYYEVQHDS